MKRTIALLLAVMLLVAVIPAAAFADSTKTAYISRRGSGSINMLKGPGYDYAYTGNYVKHNDKVTVKKISDGWAKITVKRTGKTGWIQLLSILFPIGTIIVLILCALEGDRESNVYGGPAGDEN